MDPAERLADLVGDWPPLWLISFKATPELLAERFGPAHVSQVNFEVRSFRFRCGLVAQIQFYVSTGHAGVHVDAPEAEHAIRHLGVAELVSWRASPEQVAEALARAAQAPPQPFRVIRQDDGGVRYVLAEVASEREARCLVQMYEARAHKQTYWAEPR